MKINKKLLLSSIGLASVSIVVPTVLTSCSTTNYEFINLNNFVAEENMEGGPTYAFYGVLNDEWSKKTYDEVLSDLGLTLLSSSTETQKDASNEEFKDKTLFQSVMNVATYIKDEMFGEGVTIQPNSLLNFYYKSETDNLYTNPKWLSPNDVKYDIFDKMNAVAHASYYKSDNSEEITVQFGFNMDKSYKWSNGTNYPVVFTIKTPWEASASNN